MFAEQEGVAPLSIFSLEDYPSIRIVRLRGPIDQTTVTELEHFRKWLAGHKGFQHKHLVLDFKQVTRTDTSAVASLMQAIGDLKSANYRLGIIYLDENFRNMLHILKVDQWVTFYANESEAVKDLARRKTPDPR
jgi:anti-anti-sigma regulatory factor